MSRTIAFPSDSSDYGNLLGLLLDGPVVSGKKEPLWTGLSQRLKQARQDAQLTWAELGRICSMSHTGVTLIERGELIPRPESIEALASALGVSTVWLAFGHDGEEPFSERIQRKGKKRPEDPNPSPSKRPCSHGHKGIGNRLKEARALCGLSVRGLSRECGVSPQSLLNTEAGLTAPLISNVEAIAKALGVAPGWLAFGLGRGPDGKKTKARAVA